MLGLSIMAAVLCGCGGRTGLVGQGAGGGADGGKVAWDVGGVADGRSATRDGAAAVDQGTPRDTRSRDACLPIPAKKVSDTYKGTWKGKWSCGGVKPESISGTLSFKLSPAGSPDNFNVSGSMTGTVVLGLTFKGSINGKMGCTSLSAAMPDITVGSGPVLYQLTGTMRGAFSKTGPSSHGFKGGTWTAKEPKLKCNASGTWEAS